MAQSESGGRKVVWTLLIVLVGQVGCLTLIIILASVLAGLWLDANFHTKPLFTLILLLAGIPLSVVAMLLVARRTLARLTKEDDVKSREGA
jgi:F0F1-type ATP synthase assembly protein I